MCTTSPPADSLIVVRQRARKAALWEGEFGMVSLSFQLIADTTQLAAQRAFRFPAGFPWRSHQRTDATQKSQKVPSYEEGRT